jgi:UDP-GlcNAc:undecaprenyl-phosphate/decaprenyl-phosphate GlcNAc-1-phosphate transferase
MQALVGFILSMSVTMVLMPLLMRWAAPLGFLDMPEARKVHTTPVPRIGGIAMGGGIFAGLLLGGSSNHSMPALLAGIAVLLCFGIWDDRRSLRAAPKFAGQALAALVAILWGGVSIASLNFSDRVDLPSWAALPLTFFFLLGGTNAFNLADGLDGLAGGMAMLCFCGTALLAFTVDNAAIGGVAVVLVGAVIGFLRFNTHPARVFMGDSGSQVLGFSAAVLAVLLTQDPQVPLSTALPLLLLGMPIIDTVTVMTERLVAKRSPFKADRRHLHHRLLAIGFEHRQAVSILYVLQTALFVAAWFLRYSSDAAVLLVFGVFVAALLGMLYAAEGFAPAVGRVAPRDSGAAGGDSVGVAEAGAAARAYSPGMRLLVAVVLIATLLAYGSWVVAFGAVATSDLGWLALSLALLLGLSVALRWNRAEVSWLEKIALYSSATLAIYLGKQAFPYRPHPAAIEYIAFALIALATVAMVRESRDRRFRLTPLDILVLVVVLIVPNLPDSFISLPALGVGLAQLVLLCYAFEALSFSSLRGIRWLRGAAAVFLLGIALRALL